MSSIQQFSRVNTLQIKSQIEEKIGRRRTEMYFALFTRFLSLKLPKPKFHRLCIETIGKENTHLHNHLLRSILRNAYLSNVVPQKQCIVNAPPPPWKGKNHHSVSFEGRVRIFQKEQSASELLSLGGRPSPPSEEEDGEEVNQRRPVKAPLGIIRSNSKGLYFSKAGCNNETCHNLSELPDTSRLQKIVEQKLEREGVKVSVDCANLLNNSLDVFLKRLIKPCLELSGSRCGSVSSIQDFRAAMELNPMILGEDWPILFEKVCLRAYEE